MICFAWQVHLPQSDLWLDDRTDAGSTKQGTECTLFERSPYGA
jgi:hypothetical protein